MLLKIVLTLMTLYFAFIPVSVDVGDDHLYNPEWAAHSKVHLVWFLVFSVLMAGVSIYLLWAKDELIAPALIGLSFNFGFVFAYFTAPFYGGVDVGETIQLFPLSDMPPNLTENLLLGITFLAIALFLFSRPQSHQLA